VSGNPEQRQTLSDLLRGWRMMPLEADNAPVALALLERCRREGIPVPLAILSNKLAGQDGFLLAFRIKHNPQLASTVLMMLAAEASPAMPCPAARTASPPTCATRSTTSS
jgi:DNA-binding response OmpR family regulator